MFVNVAERHVIPRAIAEHAFQHGHVTPDHYAAFRSVRRAGHCEVSGQDRGQRGIKLFGHGADVLANDLLQRLVQFLDRFAAMLGLRQQTIAHGIRRGGDLHLAALRVNDVQVLGPANDHIRHTQRAIDVDAAGFFLHRRQIVIAHQHHHRHIRIDEALDAPRKLALQSGAGIARLEGITREDHQIDIMVQTVIDHLVEAVQKIEHAAIDAGAGIDVPVIFHADVNIGKMQNVDHGHEKDSPD
jgi:hypothetical protein